MNYYEILGVSRDASANDIEQAYRTLARRVHPDLNAGDAGRAETRMKQLNEIRETLGDPLLRAAYDDELRREDEQRTAARRAAEAGPAGEYARVVHDVGPDGVRSPFVSSFVAPPGEGRRGGGRLWGGLLIAGVLVVSGVVLGRSGRLRELLPFGSGAARAAPDPAPEVAGPSPPLRQGAAHAPTRPHTPTPRPGHRGVVKIGSTAGEVMRVLGPPERTERVSGSDVVFVYGQLRLQMRNGAVVGGGI